MVYGWPWRWIPLLLIHVSNLYLYTVDTYLLGKKPLHDILHIRKLLGCTMLAYAFMLRAIWRKGPGHAIIAALGSPSVIRWVLVFSCSLFRCRPKMMTAAAPNPFFLSSLSPQTQKN